MDKKITYKNRVEIKIVFYIFLVFIVPITIIYIISLFINIENWTFGVVPILWTIGIWAFILIINRYKILFDYSEKKIYFTRYFTRTRSFDFVSEEINDEYVRYKNGLNVKEFFGFEFAYKSNEFLVNQVLSNHWENLTSYTKKCPNY